MQKAIRHGAYHCLQHTQTFRRSFDIYRLHKVHLIWTLDEAYFTAETLYTTITTTSSNYQVWFRVLGPYISISSVVVWCFFLTLQFFFFISPYISYHKIKLRLDDAFVVIPGIFDSPWKTFLKNKQWQSAAQKKRCTHMNNTKC